MLYDIRTTPIQLKKAGEWVSVGENMADVELCADDRMLLAEQGDDRMAWDTDGSEGSEEYLSLAPLDPARGVRPTTSQLVLAVREGLRQLQDRAEDSERHTLDLVCDRWDEYEQEAGTDQLPTPEAR